MMSARMSERVMAVLQAQKNPPRRAGLGKALGSAAPSAPSATYRSMAYSAPKRKMCSCFVLQGVMVLQRRRAAQGGRTRPFVFDQGRNGETLAEGSELSSIGSPTGVPSW